MSLLRAMYTGQSGINAESEALGVVGDNIANASTIGFKEERASFEDMLGNAVQVAGPGTQAGAGVRLGSIEQMFTQGSLSTTGVSTDLALSGDGFFVVSGTQNGVTSDFYTRDGQFKLDAEGTLVNGQGMQVQGWTANADGTMKAGVGAITVPTSALAPSATTKITLAANLDSRADVQSAAFSTTDPTGTSTPPASSIVVYDSLGAAHTVDLYWCKTASDTWDYHAVIDGGDMANGTAGTPVEIGSGSLTFDPSGSLNNVATGTAISVDFKDAKPGQQITLSLGSGTSSGGGGLDGVTQFAASGATSGQSQDGWGSGALSGVSVDEQGVIQGQYSNGKKLALGQVAIAKFASNEGLGRAGSSLWVATEKSGQAVLGAASSGGRGAVSGGSLEQSTVDLAQQFVGLIAHQRSFQANSRTITTVSDMLQELVQLGR